MLHRGHAVLSVRLSIGPGRQVQGRARAVVVVVAESDAPESIDHEGTLPLAQETSREPLSLLVPLVVLVAFLALAERVDPAVAEVADEQTAAELAEARARGRGERHAPGGIQQAVIGHLRDQVPVCVELSNETVAMAG